MGFFRAIASLAIGLTMMVDTCGYVMPHQDPSDILILVNKTNRAPIVPVTLVKPNVTPTKPELSENIYMRPEAAAALEELFDAAAQEGVTLYATSGFRSYSTQKAIYERKLERMDERQANASVAKPGYSEHQTGLAMDVEGETTLGTGLTAQFGESPEGIWLAENCYRFGFIIRYPEGKRSITGYIYEPWHIRYVGRKAAAEIEALDVTFEEYILMVRADRVALISGQAEASDDQAVQMEVVQP